MDLVYEIALLRKPVRKVGIKCELANPFPTYDEGLENTERAQQVTGNRVREILETLCFALEIIENRSLGIQRTAVHFTQELCEKRGVHDNLLIEKADALDSKNAVKFDFVFHST
jgi:hypothetical protein